MGIWGCWGALGVLGGSRGLWGGLGVLGGSGGAAPPSFPPSRSEISEITSIKKEDVISTLQYLNLINYYKVRPRTSGGVLNTPGGV